MHKGSRNAKRFRKNHVLSSMRLLWQPSVSMMNELFVPTNNCELSLSVITPETSKRVALRAADLSHLVQALLRLLCRLIKHRCIFATNSTSILAMQSERLFTSDIWSTGTSELRSPFRRQCESCVSLSAILIVARTQIQNNTSTPAEMENSSSLQIHATFFSSALPPPMAAAAQSGHRES